MRDFREGLQAAISSLTWTEADAQAVRVRLAKEGGHIVERKLRWGAVLAALLILALAGAALAATDAFGILGRLFPDGAPGERAQKLVVPVGETYGDGENTFTVQEYIFDGRELHVEWQARTADDGLVLFTASGLTTDAGQPFSPQEALLNVEYNGYAALGGAYGATLEGYTAGGFSSFQTEPFTATMRVYFLRPAAPIYMEGSPELEGTREGPMILLGNMGDGYCPASPTALYEVFRHGTGSTRIAHDEGLPAGADRIGYYESQGYYAVIGTYEVSFTVTPNAEAITSTRIAGQTVFETEDYRIEFAEAEFNAAGTRLLWYVQSKTGLPFDEDWVYMLGYTICVNGEELLLEQAGGGNADGFLWEAWGNPVAGLPAAVEITPCISNRMRYTGADARIPEGTQFPTMTVTLEPVALAQ